MKRIYKTLLPILILVLVGTAVKVGLDSRKVEGYKEIEIVFIAEDDEFYREVIKGSEFLAVGDVLTRVEEDGQLSFVFDGDEDSEWGRFIVGVEEYITEDMATGPWWLYDSPTNEHCISAGFCEGIDLQPLEDGDTFIFTFSE